MLSRLIAVLSNPAARDAIAGVAGQLLASSRVRAQSPAERDYERLHWGSRPRGGAHVELPPPADRYVVLGDLSHVGYLTAKGGDDEPEDFVHFFGEEDDDGQFSGARPLLVVGFYDDGRKPELFILRGTSPFTVTTHGIED